MLLRKRTPSLQDKLIYLQKRANRVVKESWRILGVTKERKKKKTLKAFTRRKMT
jgi:hypothetical protein